MRSVPFDVDGLDLAPIVVDEIASLTGAWLDGQLREIRRIGRLLDELRPGAILLSHEGVRTTWLAAARQARVPLFAIQHGMIYPSHPFYEHARHPGLILPDRTFVFGDYERRALLQAGHFEADEVEVTGAPRSPASPEPNGGGRDPETVGTSRRDPEAAALRRRLGVAEGERILVVSTASVPIVRRFLVVDMIERVLGGPLPNVHVVFKLHPGGGRRRTVSSDPRGARQGRRLPRHPESPSSATSTCTRCSERRTPTSRSTPRS